MKRIITAVLAVVLCVACLSGCKSMSDEMMAAVGQFTEQVTRITDQVKESGELVTQAEELIASKKPVSDVTTTSKLQAVVEEVKENVKFETPKRPASLDAITEKVEELKNIDFTSYIDKLKNAIQGVINSQEDYAMNDTLVSKGADGWGVYDDSGKLDTSYTGIAKNEYGSWYIKDGKADFSFSGTYEYAGKTFTVNGGKVQ